VNLLRHTHATFARRGDQFVVRKDEPTAPPEATRVPLWYVRGGGMLLRAGVSSQNNEKETLLVDTSSMFPVGLDDAMWKKAGVDLASLTPAPGATGIREGTIPMLKFAGFDLPGIPAVEGAPVADLKASVDLDLGGIVGAGLLSLFRVTFGDEGRFLWLEADPQLLAPPGRASDNASQSAGVNRPQAAPPVPAPAASSAPSSAPAPKGNKP
jgi:hypothetical protein